jgi:hypothetical protein
MLLKRSGFISGRSLFLGGYQMANRTRKIPLQFYVTEQERDFIEQKMQFMQTKNQSAYLRKMALDGYILNVDYSMFREINSSLQHISNSINQIAKRVNSTDNIYSEDIELLKEKQEEVWRLQKSILSRLP